MIGLKALAMKIRLWSFNLKTLHQGVVKIRTSQLQAIITALVEN